MKLITTTALVGATAIASLATASAYASDLDYTYAELRFVDTELDPVDGDGIRIGGSYDLDNNWLVVAELDSLDYDFSTDLTTISVGAGYVHRYTDTADLVGYARLIRTEVDTAFGSADENGFSVSGGVRARLTPQFEARALLTHIDVLDSDTFVEVGGDFYINEQFSVGATLEFIGDADTLTVGVRWFFGD